MLVDSEDHFTKLPGFRKMTLRRAKDALLLSIWVMSYHALIRSFAALQRIERFLAGFKREGAKASRPL